MKTINFQVEDALHIAFRAKVDKEGMKVSGVFKSLMKRYSMGEFETEHVSRETPPASRGLGRPPKEKEPQTEELVSDPFEAFKNNVAPDKRLLISYNYVLQPERFDTTLSLKIDSSGQTGTLEDMFREEWLEFRLRSKMLTPAWIDGGGLELFLICLCNKFVEVNKTQGRYRRDDLWADGLTLDGEMVQKNMEILKKQIPEEGD